MSTICRKNINLKTFRQLLRLKNIPRCSHSQRTTLNLNILHRHQYFSSVAEAYKTGSVSLLKESAESVPDEYSIKAVDQALVEIDQNVQRTGRIQRNHVENVFSMIQKMGFASETQSLYLLRSCGLMRAESASQRIELAHQIWQKLIDYGTEFDVSHFNTLLKLQVDCNHEFSPSEFLASMEKYKVEPNKVTYLYLLDKYCNDGNMTGASEILQFLKDKGLSINEKVFNILIKGHMKANDAEGANQILEVMRSSNLSPTAESYTALACGYAEQGNIEAVKSCIEKLENLSRDYRHLLNIISSLSSEEHVEFVEEMIEKIDDLSNWRQHCINTILDLIHKDMDVFAFKLTLAICTPDSNAAANIFAKEMINAGKPILKVLEYCDEIHARGINDHIHVNSAKGAIDNGKFDHAMALFEAMEKKGVPVRLQTFWPIFTHYRNSEEDVLSTLNKMTKFGLPADFTTYYEHTFPAMSLDDPTEVIFKIQETGQPPKGVIDPLFSYYCYLGDVDNAYFLIERYSPIQLTGSFNFERFLSSSKSSRNKSQTFTKVLNYVMQNTGSFGSESEVRSGKNLAFLIQTNSRLFESVVENMHNQKWQFSMKTLETCYDILKKESSQLLIHFDKLKSFKSVPPMRQSSGYIENEDEEFDSLKQKGMLSRGFLLDRLHYHIRSKNFARVDHVVGELDNLQNFGYPPFLLSHLLSLYCESNNFEKAEQTIQRLKKENPTFKLDTMRNLDYATLLIKYSKYEDAAEIVRQECEEPQVYGNREGAIRIVKKLLNAAVETGNIDLLQKLQNSLSHHQKLLESKAVLFEPLIKIHLYKNDIESALQEFRNCVINHRVAPCLIMLLKKCITEEDHAKLDLVIDLASTIKGNKKAILRELAMAYLETGRPAQAMKIIESFSSEQDAEYFENECLALYSQKRVLELEQLMLVLRGQKFIDQEKIFYYALKLYGDKNDFKKVQDLYQIIVNENLFEPSSKTQQLLNSLFEKNDQPAPFSIVSESRSSSPGNLGPMNDQTVRPFLDCLDKKDAHGVLQMLEKMKKGEIRSLSLIQMNKIIDLLINEKCLGDLVHNVNAMSYLIDNTDEILRGSLESYARAGDIEALNSLASILPDFSLKKCSFGSHLAKAYFACGKHEEFLQEMENRWDKRNKMFSFASFEELMKIPHLESRVIDLALNYAKVNFDLPLAVVWGTYLIREEYEKARQFYENHPVPADKVDSLVLKTVRQKEDVTMGREYINAIDKLSMATRTQERAYGTLLEVLVNKGMHDDAVSLIAEAKERNIQVGRQNRSSLINLRAALQRQNKDAPFSIPF